MSFEPRTMRHDSWSIIDARSGRPRELHGHVILENLIQYNLGNPKQCLDIEKSLESVACFIYSGSFPRCPIWVRQKLCLPRNTPMATGSSPFNMLGPWLAVSSNKPKSHTTNPWVCGNLADWLASSSRGGSLEK